MKRNYLEIHSEILKVCDKLCSSDDPFDNMKGEAYRKETNRLVDEWYSGLLNSGEDFSEKVKDMDKMLGGLLEELRKS